MSATTTIPKPTEVWVVIARDYSDSYVDSVWAEEAMAERRARDMTNAQNSRRPRNSADYHFIAEKVAFFA